MTHNLLGIIMVLIGSILFSAKAIFVKLIYIEGLDGIEALTLRLLFALPFYIASLIWIIHFKKVPEFVKPSHYLIVAFYGFLGYYFASYFDFIGLMYISAGLERLVLFIYPTLVVLLNYIFFQRKLMKWDILALFITYSGILIAYLHDAQLGGENVNLGVLCVLLSALTYAVYLMGSGHWIPKMGVNFFTTIAMLTAVACVFLQFTVTRNWSRFLDFNCRILLIGFFLGVFTTVIPSYLISAGIHRIGSSKSSILSSIGPVSTLILAYFILGESIGFYQILGTFLVLLGVVLIGKRKYESS
jgi:drug/metabolite transporter (DMT)-like permease